MKFRFFGLITALLLLSIQASAQISSIYTVDSTTCSYSNDGSITYMGVEACFAPINVVLDTTTIMDFNTLKNDGYDLLHHGAGPGTDIGNSVWGGNTSIGDVYIATGIFTDSIRFDDSVTVYGDGDQNMFTVCFDAATNDVVWATTASAGSATYTAGLGVTGNADKCWVVGYLTDGTIFQNDTVQVASGNNFQGFIAKYDIPSGNIDTVIQLGETGADEISNVHYAAGQIYVVGNFQNSITLAGNGFFSVGDYDPFVTCFDTTLATNIWGATGGSSLLDIGTDLVAYVNGSGITEKVFVTGEFRDFASFDGTTVTSNGDRDFFIAAVDTGGTWLWAESSGGTGDQDRAISIDINSTGDQIYVGGIWGDGMTFGGQSYTATGSADGFIAYMDTSGAVNDFYPFVTSGFGQVVDLQSIDDDYLVFAANFTGSVDYADSTFATNGQSDAFLGKIGPDQHEIWGKNFGGSTNDAWNSVRVGADTRLHSTGFFSGDASAYQSGLVSQADEDVVISSGVFTGIADTMVTLTGLTAGEYYAVMTDSNGNVIIDTIVVPGPDTIQIAGVVTNALTGSSNDGAIDITVTGGTPGYNFSWSNASPDEDISGLDYGMYTVTVTDTNGCIAIDSFLVDTGQLVLGITGIVTDMVCGGDSSGAIDIILLGGNAPFSYAWNTGDTTQDLTGIGGGMYTITVNDADSTVIDSFFVYEPPVMNVNGTVTPPTNGTSNDGAVNLTVSGGIPDYTFAWSNSDTTEDISNLPIGLYTVTVTDSIGCMKVLTFDVDTIAALSLVLSPSAVTCINTDNGSVDLTVVGGAPPFTFAWSNSATTEDIFGLAAGTYTVTVTDSVSQQAIGSATIASNPQFPDPVVGPISGPGSAQAWTTFNYNVPSSNGSSFSWDATGGSITAIASNAATVQWDAGPDGIIYVGETDANGCYAMDSLVVNILFVGIDETHENSILVYPNPASDQLTVALPEAFNNPKLVIRDMSGRIVENGRLRTQTTLISLTDFNPGVYIMTLSTPEGTVNHRFVVQ